MISLYVEITRLKFESLITFYYMNPSIRRVFFYNKLNN